jgi:hypothetical protein
MNAITRTPGLGYLISAVLAGFWLCGCPQAPPVIPPDVTPPTLSLNGEPAVATECGEETYHDAGAVAVDDRDETVEAYVLANTVEPGNPGQYVITYGARDAAGNEAAPVTRQVEVVDTQPPHMPTLPAEVVLECGAAFVPSEGVALDSCAGEVPLTAAGVPKSNFPVGEHTVRYSALDPAGNEAVFDQVVRVVDSEAPEVLGPAQVNLECGSAFAPIDFSAVDACDGPVAVLVGTPGVGTAPGDFSAVVSAVDASGNTATRTVAVHVKDTQAPTFSSAPPEVTLNCGEAFVPSSITATDVCSGEVEVAISGLPDPLFAIGDHVVRYAATDESGNEMVAHQVVHVVDTVPPVLTGIPAELALECGDSFPALGSAEDACAGPVTLQIEDAPGSDSGPGEYTVTYWAVDPAANEASFAQTVTIADTTAPEVTLQGAETLVLIEGQGYSEPGVTAWDRCDGVIEVTASGEVDTSLPGTYTIEYQATDSAGNVGTATRVVTVETCPDPGIWSHSFAPSMPITGHFKPFWDFGFALPTTDCGFVSLTATDPEEPVLYRVWDGFGNVLSEFDDWDALGGLSRLARLADGSFVAVSGEMAWVFGASGTPVWEGEYAAFLNGASGHVRTGFWTETRVRWAQTGWNSEVQIVAPDNTVSTLLVPGMYLMSARSLADGGWLAVGYPDGYPSQVGLQLRWYSAAFTELRRVDYPTLLSQGVSVWITEDALYLGGTQDDMPLLMKLDSDGNVLRIRSFPFEQPRDLYRIARNEDGEFFFAGSDDYDQPTELLKISADWEPLWQTTIAEGSDGVQLLPSKDGGVLLFLDSREGLERDLYRVLLRVDAAGNLPPWPGPPPGAE